MESNLLTFSTPGLLFPAVSLLMLAYTNRFLGLAGLVRDLISEYHQKPSKFIKDQVENLRIRIGLLRHVQAMGVSSLFLCTVTMFCLLMDQQIWARFAFTGALLCMLISLGLALIEIHLSVHALNIEVRSLDTSKR
jgi:hypothetical protein